MTKRGPSELYALNPEEVRQLVAAPQTLEERIVVKVPFYLGLRVSELVHLRAGWLVGRQEIRIPSAMWCVCAQCLKKGGEWQPKTKAGARVLPLVELVREDALALLTHYPQGLEISRFSALRMVKRVMKRAGIKVPGLGDDTAFVHALRATCATMLAAAGLNQAMLCYTMGWSSLEVAEKYIKLAAARANAAAAMEKAFGG